MRDRSVLSRSTSRYCHLAGSVERFAPSYYFLTQHTSTYPHEERFARNITLALTRKIQSFRNFGRPTLLFFFSKHIYIYIPARSKFKSSWSHNVKVISRKDFTKTANQNIYPLTRTFVRQKGSQAAGAHGAVVIRSEARKQSGWCLLILVLEDLS